MNKYNALFLGVAFGVASIQSQAQTISFEEIQRPNTFNTISMGVFSQGDGDVGDVTRFSFSPTDDIFISRHRVETEQNLESPINGLIEMASRSVNGFTLPLDYKPALQALLNEVAKLPEAKGQYLGLSVSIHGNATNLNPETNQVLRIGIFLAEDANRPYHIARNTLLRPGDFSDIAQRIRNGADFSDVKDRVLLEASEVTGATMRTVGRRYFERNFNDARSLAASDFFPAPANLYTYSHTQKAIVLTERFSDVRNNRTTLTHRGDYQFDRQPGFYLSHLQEDPAVSNHIRSLAFRIAQILQGEPHGLSIRAVMQWLHYLSFQPEADNHYLGALVNYDRGYPRIHFFYTSDPNTKPVDLSEQLVGSLDLPTLQNNVEQGLAARGVYSFINTRTGNVRNRTLPEYFLSQAREEYEEYLANIPVTDEMIERYAPRVLLHPYEYTMPMAADDFLAQATLKYYDEANQVHRTDQAADDITAEDIDATPQWQWFADIPERRQSEVYRGAPVDHRNQVHAPVYVRLLDHSKTHTDIQYMMFYPFNGCQNLRVAYIAPQNLSTHRRNVPLCNLARHEGDWEHVTVRVNNDTQQAEAVFMSGHGSGDWYSWDAPALTLQDGHPVVYSALNSHAGYPRVGTFTDEDLGAAVTAAGVALGSFNGTPVTSAKVVDTTNRAGSLRFDHYPNRRHSPVWETWQTLIRAEDTAWHNLNLKWGNDYNNVDPAFSLPNMEGNAENTVMTVARVAADLGLLDRFRRGSSPRTLTQQASSRDLGEFFQPTISVGDIGTSGNHFSDQHALGSMRETLKVTRIGLRAGRRVDRIFMDVEVDGSTQRFSHGGSSGTERTLTLDADEFVTQLNVHVTRHNGSDRVSYMRYVTNKGRTLEGGSQTDRRYVLSAQAGHRLVGFYGRSGDEVDHLGALQAPSDRWMP